jgi:hypothetical protein
MPTSVNPLVVALGASPGNSPAAAPWHGIAPQLPYPPPTFGVPHAGLFYPDGSSYWAKMRLLLAGLVRAIDPGASDDDALAVSGHLNLGTGLFGRATAAATEADIARWAARLIVGPLSPRILVTVGLDGLLKAAQLRTHLSSGGLDVPWQRPDFAEPLTEYRYRFKLWRLPRAEGGSLTIVGWPNHPSRIRSAMARRIRFGAARLRRRFSY